MLTTFYRHEFKDDGFDRLLEELNINSNASGSINEITFEIVDIVTPICDGCGACKHECICANEDDSDWLYDLEKGA